MVAVDLELVTLEPKPALGIAEVIPSSFAPDAAVAEAKIEALFAYLGALVCDDARPRFGIATPADGLIPPHRITYVAAVLGRPTLATSPQLTAFELGGGRYAIARYEGPTCGIDAFYLEAYEVALGAHGLRTRDGQHVERRLTPTAPGMVRLEAWIPVADEVARAGRR